MLIELLLAYFFFLCLNQHKVANIITTKNTDDKVKTTIKTILLSYLISFSLSGINFTTFIYIKVGLFA